MRKGLGNKHATERDVAAKPTLFVAGPNTFTIRHKTNKNNWR